MTMATLLRISVPIALALSLFAGCKKEEGGESAAAKTEEKQESNVVTLSEESLKNVELKTETAQIGALNMRLRIPGRIAPDANRTAKVSATLEGRLAKLSADLGDKVTAGSTLGLVETPELLDKPLTLRSPIAGVITEKNGTVGELIGKGQVVYTVSDPDRLWLIGEVKERDVALVRAGQNVDFTVLSYPQSVFHGKISRVGNAVEAETRTFEVRVEIGSQGGKLKPGMFADMEITTEVLHNALVISDEALQTEGEDQIAFVALDGNRFEKRIVKLGQEQEGRVQILDGLKPGEKVVTEGSFTLKSEMLKGELGEE